MASESRWMRMKLCDVLREELEAITSHRLMWACAPLAFWAAKCKNNPIANASKKPWAGAPPGLYCSCRAGVQALRGDRPPGEDMRKRFLVLASVAMMALTGAAAPAFADNGTAAAAAAAPAPVTVTCTFQPELVNPGTGQVV